MQLKFSKNEILPLIDSTLLRPNIVEADLVRLCDDAKKYSFAAVCVNPIHVKFCKKMLKTSVPKIRVATVVGFPLGETSTQTKVAETKAAFKMGADEVDVMICISAVKAGDWDYIKKELTKVVAASKKRVVKIILETGYLTKDEIKRLCEACVEAKVRYVKTSTGYGPGGADLKTIGYMREIIGSALRVRGDDMLPCEIKASGGIKDFKTALLMAEAGAKRIGTSSAVEIAEYEEDVEAEAAPKKDDDMFKAEKLDVEIIEDDEEEAKAPEIVEDEIEEEAIEEPVVEIETQPEDEVSDEQIDLDDSDIDIDAIISDIQKTDPSKED